MLIMVWTFTLVMPTRPVYLQNSCTILSNHKYILPVFSFMVVEHPFLIRQYSKRRRFVCLHSRNLLKNTFLQNPCLQLSKFNLIFVLKTTNFSTYFDLVIARGKMHLQRGVYMSFLMMGHTYNNINTSFSHWSKKLYEEDFATIPLLMEPYINLDNMPVIPHIIEEIPNFKTSSSHTC